MCITYVHDHSLLKSASILHNPHMDEGSLLVEPLHLQVPFPECPFAAVSCCNSLRLAIFCSSSVLGSYSVSPWKPFSFCSSGDLPDPVLALTSVCAPHLLTCILSSKTVPSKGKGCILFRSISLLHGTHWVFKYTCWISRYNIGVPRVRNGGVHLQSQHLRTWGRRVAPSSRPAWAT